MMPSIVARPARQPVDVVAVAAVVRRELERRWRVLLEVAREIVPRVDRHACAPPMLQRCRRYSPLFLPPVSYCRLSISVAKARRRKLRYRPPERRKADACAPPATQQLKYRDLHLSRSSKAVPPLDFHRYPRPPSKHVFSFVRSLFFPHQARGPPSALPRY